MTNSQPRYHRRSIRLPAYDYAQAGAYFVTIVCRDRALLLEAPRFREVVEETWLWLADQYESVHLDEFVVMPNHLHGIIVIEDKCRGGSRAAPTQTPKRKPLGQLVGAFKTVSTKRINEIRGTLGVPVWQRNYYERVIRDDEELNRVRQYVVDNPAHWEEDRENPNNVGPVREPPLPD
jgi:REP element-mobilizing transposase RayT